MLLIKLKAEIVIVSHPLDKLIVGEDAVISSTTDDDRISPLIFIEKLNRNTETDWFFELELGFYLDFVLSDS